MQYMVGDMLVMLEIAEVCSGKRCSGCVLITRLCVLLTVTVETCYSIHIRTQIRTLTRTLNCTHIY